MKKRIVFLVILPVLCLLASCIGSLRPLYTDKDLVFDPKMVGDWQDKEGVTWKIQAYTDAQLTLNHKGYMVSYRDKDDSGRLVGNLVKLNGLFFLDLYPVMPMEGKNSFLVQNFLPVHTYFKVKVSDKEIGLYSFASQKLYELLGENRIRLKHEDMQDYKIITASTQEIQQFVIKYAAHDELFDYSVLSKK